ncbi:hypothetical protein H5407_06955 [Mitsuaria sp. WAJ17]|uniref:hypothetical protein n=1 Tax=Mitsuaria sp. WAJ17 TaxID=2761452 RepID=UPI0016048A1D|nr:hypothetical protein [Mitsuaria sp. WAJ17]MBB2484966.1 hypothetical protein [Mitsuaria sp. WAJ17]
MQESKAGQWASAGLAFASAWVIGGLLSACGGGGPSVDATQQLSLQLQTPSLPSGSVQVREWRLVNEGPAEVAEAFVDISDEARVRQVRWDCESASAAVRCERQADGRLRVAKLGAGARVSLLQSVKTEAGLSAELPIDVRLQGGGGSVASSRHSSRWRSFDLAVTAGTPVEEMQGETRVQHYAFTLSNAGPDDALDVTWTHQPLPKMQLLDLKCSSSEEGLCPARMAPQTVLARVPKGATVQLRATYAVEPQAASGVWSWVEAAGELRTDNNAVALDAAGREMPAFQVVSFGGQRMAALIHWRGGGMSLQTGDQLQAVDIKVDLTGAVFEYRDIKTPTGVQTRAMPLVIRSDVLLANHDTQAGSEMYLGLRHPVRTLDVLEGATLNILGTAVGPGGQLLGSYARQGKFGSKQFILCQGDAGMSVDECPASLRKVYAVTLVGDELELLSGTEVIHARASQLRNGSILLFRSERDGATGAQQVWLGLSYVSGLPYWTSNCTSNDNWHLVLGNFASPGGVMLDIGGYADKNWVDGRRGSVSVSKDSGSGLPLIWKLSLLENKALNWQVSEGQLDGLAIPGLVEGVLHVDEGRYLMEPGAASRQSGKVWGAVSDCRMVLLGQPGSSLAGRWTLKL